MGKSLFIALAIAFSSTLSAYGPVLEDAHWDVVGEFVYMRRQHSINRSLILDPDKKRYCGGCTDYAVLRTKDLINDQGFEPGFRTALIYRYSPKWSFEGQMLWLSPWMDKQERKREQSLYFGFKDPNYSGDYIDADLAEGSYHTNFWDAEVNGWNHWTPRGVDYFSLSGILGIRYFHFNEGLTITYRKGDDKSRYHIYTKSDAFGLQLGLDLQVNPTPVWTWEFIGKFGFMMNHEEQRQHLKDDNNTVTLRNFKRMQWQDGCFADVMALFGWQFKEHLQMHAGYQLIYLSGMATAEDQISKRLSSGAGKNVNTNGVVMIQGLFTGLVISF